MPWRGLSDAGDAAESWMMMRRGLWWLLVEFFLTK